MSSSNRGGQRSPADFYSTPLWCVRRLLKASELHLPAGIWLEPAVGNGAIVRAVNSVRPPTFWSCIDIRPSFDNASFVESNVHSNVVEDFLSAIMRGATYDVAITNPPFSLAMEFIHKCRSIADHTIMLLRLNFLGSEERSRFMRDTKPDLYILPNRPEFAMSVKCNAKPKCLWVTTLPITEARPTACGECGGKVSIVTSDSIEYAWFHWHANSQGKWTMLAETPLEERKVGQYGR